MTTVRYEDDRIVIVDKPSGLPTQSARGGGDNLYDRLRADRPYVALHHRLDTAASGLVLFVVDPAVNSAVAAAFREHRITRSYLAVAWGEVDPGPTFRWERPVDGKPAITEGEVLGSERGLTALLLRPITGRKHQLRVHAALAGTPLVGDPRYGGDAARRWPRLALHATRLVFEHPTTGQPVEVGSPLPEDLLGLCSFPA